MYRLAVMCSLAVRNCYRSKPPSSVSPTPCGGRGSRRRPANRYHRDSHDTGDDREIAGSHRLRAARPMTYRPAGPDGRTATDRTSP
ncbi:hypothetical protein C8039_01805 [Halogeometricum sp. wsp3]|nr:hypothetical protein C8039_01805 [Halogeometricum sp. wsp3]